MDAEVVFLYIYNTGTKFNTEELKGFLKNPEDFSKYEYTRPTPEEVPTFSMPSIFNLKDEILNSGSKQYKVKVQTSIYNTGSFAIRLRIKDELSDQQLLDLAFDKQLKSSASAIAERARQKTEKGLAKIKQISTNSAIESYMFYYVNSDKDKFLKQYKNTIAGLLIDEPNVALLDDQYINDVLNKNIKYSTSDILFVGWESAFMIDNTGTFEHELIISEIANVQLLEMEIYNKDISHVIKETEDTIKKVISEEPFSGKVLRKASIKVSDAYDRISDMSNAARATVSGFGEWYLSRLYSLFYDVFKLGEWQALLDDGLEVIEKRREFIVESTRSHRMDLLEIIVIVLIIVEVVIEVLFMLRLNL